MSISSEERKRVIVEQLKLEGQVKVPELCLRFTVSEETVRRDLVLLEREGLVKRVYGGAVLTKPSNYEPPYLQRQMVKAEEKARIGRAAANLIESGDTIAIDVGTTTLELAKAIVGRERLTILTHSLAVAYHLMESLNSGKFTGKIIVIGGELNPEQQSMSGSLGESMMSQFRVDKAFISVGGISLSRGMSDYDLGETVISRRMVEAASQTIVLADDSKFDKEAFIEIMPLRRVHIVVSNVAPPREWAQMIRNNHLQWTEAK
ncbi:DeoR/GlpR family DNA-binding transcription regulator [Paenibacillus macquariensis]|uniref:Transcriptional regulator, DeoR family n=1 Tax=Paenibacillus macquariensis TaxID=948756 RepID=A0ABY1K5T4_9BACL|nr:DeoR/GlpR family DNA-binding transcription regulator [Paenibacillus macquariensis]MEC0090519.1 DeoR/GlpR family DNA-binding transcription regulator [Paenibacillus macquariensis]OAB38520.1 DeoR family transcriptional regulator [Paenibacillus macquariensis subsp. macquariensis]SIR30494.1 transcriptional regulator, DeoR family [Paenibacillus macquariensis]